MVQEEKYAVIGAGCGGQAIAGYLASNGYDVALYNRSSGRINPFQERGYVDLEGILQGRGELSSIGSDISEAVADRDVIMVVITANGHKEIAEKMAPHLRDGQIIMLNPGRTCGALEVNYTLRQCGCKAKVIIAEANTLAFTVRVATAGIATIKGVKKEVAVAALHAEDTEHVIETLSSAFPQFKAVSSFIETSFGNIGAIFHPTITLLNKDRILAGEEFDFYTDGVSRKVADFVDEVDYEAKSVAGKLGATVLSVTDWLGARYNLKLSDIYTMTQSNAAYQGIKAPRTLDTRYLWEDIPTGLVPISTFGDALGVDTSAIDRLINEGCDVLGRDFWKEGRTLDKLGLSKENLLSDIKKIIGCKRAVPT
jgi:opine dehydrogenase